MDKQLLGKALLEAAYLEGDFVLRSGRRSKYYLDKYLFETDPQILRALAAHMADVIRSVEAERGERYVRIAAPELGAVVLGAALSLELNLPLLLVRKASKEYGTAKRLEGRFAQGDRVALVEDIVTSGGAAIQAAEILREVGLRVEEIYCVVDREEGGKQAAEAVGLKLIPVFTASELGIRVSESGSGN
ncbi:MAG: orotate phosphoribosyltransferase [Thermoleophilia bacterium]|nr:orotate phosphoribosyltransferase [Thermoleophilia bacterium]